MDETNENINSENESRRDNSDTRVAGTRFGQNLWLEVERWRRHQPNMKRNLRNETNHQSEACSSSVSYDGQDCVPSSSKKARYAWQVKRSSTSKAKSPSVHTTEGEKVTEVFCDGNSCNKSGLPTDNCCYNPPKSETVNEEVPQTSSSTVGSHCTSCRKNTGCIAERCAKNKSYDLSKMPSGQCSIRKVTHVAQSSGNDTSSAGSSSVQSNRGKEKKSRASLKRKLGSSSEEALQGNQTIQPTFLERWQKKHIAKAVVDNAVNKTLSELGLSPDSDFNQFLAESRNVEQEGVSAVIRSRGLRQQPLQASDIFQRLAPAVDQFNDATERLSFNGMFHMVGCLDFNPLPRPSPLGNAQNVEQRKTLTRNKYCPNEDKPDEKVDDPGTNNVKADNMEVTNHDSNEEFNSKDVTENETEVYEKPNSSDSDKESANNVLNSTKQLEPQPVNVIDEALCVAIAERGLVFGVKSENETL